MNASTSGSATMATTIAFSTNAAGPSLHSFSKADSIAPSETGVRSVLRALLVGGEARNVLPRRYLQAQSATVGLRSESSDLIDPREIFRARGEEYASGKPPLAPSRQTKSQARNSGKPPFCRCP